MTEIKVGTKVHDLISETYQHPRYRDRGAGTVSKIFPGKGQGNIWPYFLTIKWDAGYPTYSDRTIRLVRPAVTVTNGSREGAA